jgi:ribosome-binding factor A
MGLFQEGRFEHEVGGMFSILEVSPSRGFEVANVFVAALDPAKTDGIVARLNEMSGEIRYALASAARLRSTPALVFRADVTLERAGRIEKILASDGVKEDLAEK